MLTFKSQNLIQTCFFIYCNCSFESEQIKFTCYLAYFFLPGWAILPEGPHWVLVLGEGASPQIRLTKCG